MAARPPDRLRDYRAVIERGLSTFTEVGHALAEIRDSRLYLLRSKSLRRTTASGGCDTRSNGASGTRGRRTG